MGGLVQFQSNLGALISRRIGSLIVGGFGVVVGGWKEDNFINEGGTIPSKKNVEAGDNAFKARCALNDQRIHEHDAKTKFKDIIF